MLEQLDEVICRALTDFVEDIFATGWLGREREAISLFALGYLPGFCKPDFILKNPAQIGIEVAVPQIQGPRRKRQVTKDLVIWREPAMTCWNADWEPVKYPMAILEWKAYRAPTQGRAKISSYDVDWLCKFSTDREDFVGYAVTLDLLARRFRLMCTRVHQGRAAAGWLSL